MLSRKLDKQPSPAEQRQGRLAAWTRLREALRSTLWLVWGSMVFLGVLAAAEPPLAPVVVRTFVDKALATTGEVITYTIELEYQDSIKLAIPELGSEIAGLRISDFARTQEKLTKERWLEKRSYQLRADIVGSYVLPALTLIYDRDQQIVHGANEQGAKEVAAAKNSSLQELATSPIFIEIKSVLPKDGQELKLRDIKPLIPAPRSLKIYFWLGGLGLLCLVAGLWYVKRPRLLPPAVPALPPEEVAYRALAALREQDFTDSLAVQQYYFSLSLIMRSYLEARLGFNATDLTTEEILARLSARQEQSSLAAGSEELWRLTAERSRLKEFFLATDSVKYAQSPVGPADMQQIFSLALSLIKDIAATLEMSNLVGKSSSSEASTGVALLDGAGKSGGAS